MLRWPIRLASVVAVSVLFYGWGDFATDPSPTGVVVLGLLTVVLGVSLVQLYRPGGMAAFTFDDDPAPRERPARPRRHEPAAVAPAPSPRPAPEPPRARRERTGPLWSRAGTQAAPAPRPPSAPAPEPSAPPLDLNAAQIDELAMLPGIGRGAAARVIAHREAHGPFGSVAELAGVEGFDEARAARVAGRLRV